MMEDEMLIKNNMKACKLLKKAEKIEQKLQEKSATYSKKAKRLRQKAQDCAMNADLNDREARRIIRKFRRLEHKEDRVEKRSDSMFRLSGLIFALVVFVISILCLCAAQYQMSIWQLIGFGFLLFLFSMFSYFVGTILAMTSDIFWLEERRSSKYKELRKAWSELNLADNQKSELLQYIN